MKSLKNVACRSETLRRIGSLSPDSRRQWGKMTASQMVCHLGDSYQMASGERPAKNRSSLTTRTWLRWRFLYLPVPWPRGLPTSPRNDAQGDGTQPTEFASDMDRLRRVFEVFVRTAVAGHCDRHPLFGALTPSEWLR